MCDRVAERFAECGVTVGKRYDSVKLHVTLMNTLFRSVKLNDALALINLCKCYNFEW